MQDKIMDALPMALFFFMLLWGWRPFAFVIGRFMGWC